MAEYTSPDNDSVDFQLKSYAAVSNDAVDFETDASFAILRYASLSGDGGFASSRTVTTPRDAGFTGDGGQTNTRSVAPKQRHNTLSGNGGHTNTRVTVHPRNSTHTGEGGVTSSRTTDKSRESTHDGNGETTNERVTVQPRESTLSGDGDHENVRGGVSKHRSDTFEGDSSHDNSRKTTKPREDSFEGDGDHGNVRSGVTKTRTPEMFTTTVQCDAFADLKEVFPDERALDVTWDYYYDDPRGFGSEWLSETSEIPIEERDGFGVNFFGDLTNEIEVWVQYDATGDGTVDITSERKQLRNVTSTVTFDSHPDLGMDGNYRVFIRGLRNEDTVNQVDVGAVHQNL